MMVIELRVFIRKSQQHTIIKGLSFFVVAGLTAMYVYMKRKCSSTLSRAPPRWVIGTGQLCRLTVPAGPIARRGGAAYCHLAPRLRPYIRCVQQGMGVYMKE